MSQKLYGLLAEYENPHDIMEAAKKVREAGFTKFDVHTPFPVHGMDGAMGIKPTILPWIVLGGAIFGCSLGLGLQTWSSTIEYPLRFAGRDPFALPAFIPVTFALTILFSAFATVFGMFGLNQLPMLYHPLFKSENFKKHTDDAFFLSIESKDGNFNLEKTKAFLSEIGGKNVEEIEN